MITKTIYNIIQSAFLILFICCLLSAESFTQIRRNDKPDNHDQLNNYLNSYYEMKRVPSISAGILAGDSVYWLGVKGFSDLEHSAAATINSIYRIASISKPITAVAIMQLWEKGLINLDEDVRKYVPYFPKKKWTFTVRQLLNHTSGIRSYKEGEFHSKTYFATTREALKVFENDSLLFKPGSDYLYTTLGYTLLAAVIESTSKNPFSVYLKENILEPAGMKLTFVDVQREIIQKRARGYIKNSFRNIENSQLADLSIKIAGGGFLSNPDDLLLFAKSLLNGTLIKLSTLDTMIVPTRISRNFVNNYGLGFSLPEDRSEKLFFHSGLGTGFTAKLLVDPVLKIAVVHLINLSDRNLGSPADDLYNLFLDNEITQPGLVISDTLMYYYKAGGLDSVYSKLNEILSDDSSRYSLDHNDIAGFGKDLIIQKKNFDAIDYLKRINRLFPNSFSVLVALADAYLSDGNKGLALRNFRSAGQIDSKDRYVNSMIRRLSQ